MTDEQRKQLVIEYLKGFDNGGVTPSGRSILDLFAPDAQVYFPKWGVARGKEQIERLFRDVGTTIKFIAHHYSEFNWIFSGGDQIVCEGTSHGEHVDGPWRWQSRVGRGAMVRCVRDPRRPDLPLLRLPRSGLCRKR